MVLPKSKVWKHFNKINEESASCSKCLKVLKSSGNTTNLRKHLQIHGINLATPEPPSDPIPGTSKSSIEEEQMEQGQSNKPIATAFQPSSSFANSMSRWNNIRDDQKSRRMMITKSVQAATKVKKYKYADLLTFLDLHFQERDSISNICTEENVQQREEENPQMDANAEVYETANEVIEDQREREQPTKPSVTAKTSGTRKITFSQPQSAASTVLKYISEENQTKSLTQSTRDPVDAFLAGIAPTLKTFTPYYLNVAKSKIFAIVQQHEMEMILQQQKQRQSIPSPIYVHTSSPSTNPSHHSGHFLTPLFSPSPKAETAPISSLRHSCQSLSPSPQSIPSTSNYIQPVERSQRPSEPA